MFEVAYYNAFGLHYHIACFCNEAHTAVDLASYPPTSNIFVYHLDLSSFRAVKRKRA